MKRKYPCLILVALMLGILVLCCASLWIDTGFLKRTLDVQLVPTAEYLIHNPAPMPDYIGYISPPMGATIKVNDQICVAVWPGGLHPEGDSSGEIQRHTSIQVVINDSPIPRELFPLTDLAVLDRTRDGRFTGRVYTCFKADLEPGTHLLEVQMRDSPLQIVGLGELFSYTWAYRVE